VFSFSKNVPIFSAFVLKIILCGVSAFSPPSSISNYLAEVKLKYSKGLSIGLSGKDEATETTSISKSIKFDKELNVLLETMPEVEKYTILMQSYATQIMETNERNSTNLKMMNILFGEMLQNSIVPSSKSTQVLIDAASVFRNSESLGRALQLAKAGDVFIQNTTNHM